MLREYSQKLAVIIRIVSDSEEIDIEKFKSLCTSAYTLICSEPLSLVSITPSLHKLQGHTCELIELNNGNSLKAWSEEGMEANTKRLRQIRERLARKCSQTDYLTDVISRLWVGSDPLIIDEKNKGKVSCIQ